MDLLYSMPTVALYPRTRPGEPLVQREDDKAETVRARLEQYKKATNPLVDFYAAKGLLESFAGTESDVIYPQVRKFLDGFILVKKTKEKQ